MIDRNDPDIGKKLSGRNLRSSGQRSVVTFASFQFVYRSNPWTPLHNGTVVDALSLANWELQIPHYGCQCKKDYAIYKAENPPDFSSPEALWLWGFNLHNWVNAKLGKPELTIDEARKIWRKSDGLDNKETESQRY